MARTTRALSMAIVLVALGGCSPPPPAPTGATPSPGPSLVATQPVAPRPAATASAGPTTQPWADRVEMWRDDLARIVPALEAIHPDPFHATPKSELQAAIADLSARLPDMDEELALAGLLRVVAMVGAGECDSHTGAFLWGTGTYPVESLPLRLWLFDEELVVVDALPPQEDLIGRPILSINRHSVADVLASLQPLLPRDNEQTARLLAPRFLVIPEVLGGLDVSSFDPIRIEFGWPEGSESNQNFERGIDAISMADYNAWAGAYGLHLPVDTEVPWLARIDDALWWEVLSDGTTLFIQHNRLDRLEAGILDDLRAAMHGDGIERVVLDLRHNYGGEVSAIDPTLELFDDPAIDRPGALFVLTGRNTYSAAGMLAARLERDTSAIFVGEPMSGCPTLFGDPEQVELPATGIVLSIASDLSVGVDPNDARSTIPLDAEAELTAEDWLEGRDPALDLILEVGP